MDRRGFLKGVAALAGAGLALAAAPTKLLAAPDGVAGQLVSGQTFRDRKIVARPGQRFEGCLFERCRVVVAGGCALHACYFRGGAGSMLTITGSICSVTNCVFTGDVNPVAFSGRLAAACRKR